MIAEHFIHTEYGWCYWTLSPTPFIYNLYIDKRFRRQGFGRHILRLVIAEIRLSGNEGNITIESKPSENSIDSDSLIRFYESEGLHIRRF